MTTLKDRATETAADAAEAARAQAGAFAHKTAETLRDEATQKAGEAASALRAAKRELGHGAQPAEALRETASTIEDLTAHLRDAPIDEIVDDVASFARRNPALFLGGAALLGFAAARFLKAPSPKPTPGVDPWSGHLAAPASHGAEAQSR